MKEEVKKALENIGNALAHKSLLLCQNDHIVLSQSFELIKSELTPKEDVKDNK